MDPTDGCYSAKGTARLRSPSRFPAVPCRGPRWKVRESLECYVNGVSGGEWPHGEVNPDGNDAPLDPEDVHGPSRANGVTIERSSVRRTIVEKQPARVDAGGAEETRLQGEFFCPDRRPRGHV